MANRPAYRRTWLGNVAVVTFCVVASLAASDEPIALETLASVPLDGASAAYPDGTFGEHLATASQGGSGPIGGAKNRPGPGRRDDWRVGPHWRATVDGVLLYRTSANLDAILAQVDPIAPSTTLPPLQFQDNFEHAGGVRLLLTSEFPQCAGYELQVGYLGVDKWLANAYWERETLAAATLPLSDIDVEQQRTLGYESSLHSVEVNFQRVSPGYLKPFAGVRYIALDEQILDENRQFTTGVLGEPPAGVAGTLASAVTQTRNGVEIENNLIGFQGGVRLDMWRPTRKFEITGFLSAGIYCNIVDRDRVFQESNAVTTRERTIDGTTGDETVTTTTSSATTTSKVSADGTRIAFTTEAALAGVWRVSSSTALRAGYQVQFLDGVELAEDLWTAPPPVTAVDDSLFLHGWFAGLEYRR